MTNKAVVFPKAPLVDSQGNITPAWLHALQDVFKQVTLVKKLDLVQIADDATLVDGLSIVSEIDKSVEMMQSVDYGDVDATQDAAQDVEVDETTQQLSEHREPEDVFFVSTDNMTDQGLSSIVSTDVSTIETETANTVIERINYDPLALPYTPQRERFELTTSWATRFAGDTSGSVAIGTTEVNLTPLFGADVVTMYNDSPIYYDSTVKSFFAAKNKTDFYFFEILLRLTGTSPSTSSAPQVLNIVIRRTDGSFVSSIEFIRGRGSPVAFTAAPIVLPTLVGSGGSDQYQAQGFRVFAVGLTAGWTITSKTLFFKR